jgi:3-hydroxybutyrate dehydrogenase
MTHSAIITGSTSGIGLGIAEAFAKTGMNIMLNGFGTPEEIEQIRQRLSNTYQVGVAYSGADMSKPAEIRSLAASAYAAFGHVDVIVNNAGVQHVESVEDFPDDKWDLILSINLSAAFHLTKATLKGMKEKGWGRIINIASAHGLVASPFKSAYVAAKHGLIGFTKDVALETAQNGVTCNAICPGYVLTPLVERQIPDQAKTRGLTEEQVVRDVLLAAQPTKRFVSVAEVAGLACFLCSDHAASITGAALPIEGGWTAQ